MFSWDDLRHFLAIERHRTLAAAGRALGVDETTVGRRLAALERAVGARLFDRTADGLLLTATGRAVVGSARHMETEAAAFAARAAAADVRAQGPVRLTTTEAFGTRFLAPRLGSLRAAHPQLELEVVTDTRALDLSRREADLGVRLGPPTEGHIVARRLGDLAVGLYAAASYLERAGAPRRGLAGHSVIGFGAQPLGIPEEAWLAEVAADATVVLRSRSTPVQLAAAAAGLGIAALPCYLADGEPSLLRVLPGERVRREIWLTMRRDLRRAPRVRAVAEWLAEIVARHAALLGGALAQPAG
jgi:DNA-binding transcriptional LysR family regulator